MNFRALVLVVLLFAVAEPARAQDEIELAAIGYRELPPGIALRLELTDDSDLNLQVREMIADELMARGHRISVEAPFVLQIETFSTSGGGNDPDLGSFRADTDEGAEIRLNLWSNRQDSLLNRREDTPRGATGFRIDLGLYDSRDGRYYWRGNAGTLLTGGDAAAASRRMVPALLGHLGETHQPSEP